MNPNQKSGNVRGKRRQYKKKKALDYKMQKIARQEVSKTLAKKIESKTYEFNQFPPTGVSANGTVWSIFDPLRGTGESEIIGSRARPSHIRVKGLLQLADDTNVFRVILIQTVGGGSPVPSTVLDPTMIGTSTAPLSLYNTSYSPDFKVLFDEFYTMVSATETALLSFDIRVKGGKIRTVNYTDTGFVQSNGIYLLIISDSTAIAHPMVAFSSRIYYKDA